MNNQPTLKLWRPIGINVFALPKVLQHLFPYYSANDQDCVPYDEQDAPVKQSHTSKPALKVVK